MDIRIRSITNGFIVVNYNSDDGWNDGNEVFVPHVSGLKDLVEAFVTPQVVNTIADVTPV